MNTPLQQLLDKDSLLRPYEDILHRRAAHIHNTENRLTQGKMTLADSTTDRAANTMPGIRAVLITANIRCCIFYFPHTLSETVDIVYIYAFIFTQE